jgi:hypothetical protein
VWHRSFCANTAAISTSQQPETYGPACCARAAAAGETRARGTVNTREGRARINPD